MTTRLGLLAAIFAGGMLGAVARQLMNDALPTHGDAWPWATFTVNVVGCALLGYFVTRLQERLPPTTFRRPLLGTGLCGGLTTFSTYQIELLRFARHGNALLFAGYAVGSVVSCFAAVYLATAFSRRVRLR
jgi:fluoride exporter